VERGVKKMGRKGERGMREESGRIERREQRQREKWGARKREEGERRGEGQKRKGTEGWVKGERFLAPTAPEARTF
jgi:hypothetical protein